MSKYQIECEFNLKLCEPSMFEKMVSRTFKEPIVIKTKTFRFKMNAKEKPTNDWLSNYFRDVRDAFVGTKTEEGLVVFSVDSQVLVKTTVDGEEKSIDVFQYVDTAKTDTAKQKF